MFNNFTNKVDNIALNSTLIHSLSGNKIISIWEKISFETPKKQHKITCNSFVYGCINLFYSLSIIHKCGCY